MSYPRPGLSTCPFCGGPAECDEVDVGVGYVQCGPYQCQVCGASEMGPEVHGRDSWVDGEMVWIEGRRPEGVTDEEMKVGWYRNQISPHANTFQGQLVSHQVAKVLYRSGLLDPKPSE